MHYVIFQYISRVGRYKKSVFEPFKNTLLFTKFHYSFPNNDYSRLRIREISIQLATAPSTSTHSSPTADTNNNTNTNINLAQPQLLSFHDFIKVN